MPDPFFLLTLSGSAIGCALGFAVRRPKRSLHPLRTRRQRMVGIPAALIVASATAGAAILAEADLVVAWWRWAAGLSTGALIFTTLLFLARRWWRGVAAGLVILPLIPAIGAWVALTPGGPVLDLPCATPELAVLVNDSSSEEEPTLALVRIDPPAGAVGAEDADSEQMMAVRVLPVVDVTANNDGDADSGDSPGAVPGVSPSAGAWHVVGAAAATDTLRITVSLERYIPPLWWFPGSERVAQLSVTIDGRTATLSSAGATFPGLNRVRSDRTVEVEMPPQAGRFLQPGVYSLEYSCARVDTENV
ncbi:MAG TPA: hypothetical protein VJ932_12300 [Alkalispirochaeta sp.]|nr:hypothetical protein [Alkalispirochaeta sp.]